MRIIRDLRRNEVLMPAGLLLIETEAPNNAMHLTAKALSHCK